MAPFVNTILQDEAQTITSASATFLTAASIGVGEQVVYGFGFDSSFASITDVTIDDGSNPPISLSLDRADDSPASGLPWEWWSIPAAANGVNSNATVLVNFSGFGFFADVLAFGTANGGWTNAPALTDSGVDDGGGSAGTSSTPSATTSETDGLSFSGIITTDTPSASVGTEIGAAFGGTYIGNSSYQSTVGAGAVSETWSWSTTNAFTGTIVVYEETTGGDKILSVTAAEKSNTAFDIVKTSILAATAAEKSNTTVALVKTAIVPVTAAEKSNATVALVKTAAEAVTAAETSNTSVVLTKTAKLSTTAAETSNATIALVKTAVETVTAAETSGCTIGLVKTAPVTLTAPEVSNVTIGLSVIPPVGTTRKTRTLLGVGL